MVGQDPMKISRLEIRGGLSIDEYRSTFDESTIRRLQAFDAAKGVLRKSLGLSAYSKLRSVAHRFVTIRR